MANRNSFETNNPRKRNIPFSPPDVGEAEIEEVCQTLRSGWITTGPRTKELERRLSAYCHTEKTVCLNSATAAEELNLRILGIGEGDEVIVPAYTYTATASAAIHCPPRRSAHSHRMTSCPRLAASMANSLPDTPPPATRI